MMNLHVISGNKQSETIQSRQLEIKLSEEDVRKITEKAGAHGLTVAELIEHFIGDLVYPDLQRRADPSDGAGQELGCMDARSYLCCKPGSQYCAGSPVFQRKEEVKTGSPNRINARKERKE